MKDFRLFVIIGTLLVALLTCAPAEAQFLKKLSKGLEKVNKTVENVDKALKGNNSSKNSSSKSKTNNTVTTNQPSEQDMEAPEEEYIQNETEAGEQEIMSAATPFITPRTLFLDAQWALLDNVSDSVFWVMRGDFLNGEKYEFWKVDGTKLFDAEWEQPFSGQPIFNSGVVAMRRPSENIMKKGTICLLYSDGRIKDTGQSWSRVTEFMDGVAIVVPNIASAEAFYIDTTGKRIYPNIKVDGMSFNFIRPLRDGLRAYKALREEWGFIDAKGVVKLAPVYHDVRDFSEGYAWVSMKDGKRHLIDTAGKSVFQVPDGMGNTSDVVNGRFYIENEGEGLCYYDVQGNKLGCFQYGNRFYGGYAFITQPEFFLDINSRVIDTDMNVVREVSWKVVDAAEVSEHKPVFSNYGLAPTNSQGSYLLKPNGEIALKGFYNNKDKVVTINNFMPVSDCGFFVADINIELDAWKRIAGKVILKPTGEILWIISTDKEFLMPYEDGHPVLQSDLNSNGGSFTIKEVDINQAPVGKLPSK